MQISIFSALTVVTALLGISACGQSTGERAATAKATTFLKAAAARDTARLLASSGDTGLVRNVLGWDAAVPGILTAANQARLERAWTNNEDVHTRYFVGERPALKTIDIVVRRVDTGWVVRRAFISSEY